MSNMKSGYIQTIINVFLALRQEGCMLAIGDLLAAVRETNGKEIATLDELAKILLAFWCHSQDDQQRFKNAWNSITKVREQPSEHISPPPADTPLLDSAVNPARPQPSTERLPKELPDVATTPAILPIIPNSSDPAIAWPISRMAMARVWRRLVQDSSTGPEHILDIKVTVQRAARQGFFLRPVYRQQAQDDAGLVIMIDQRGSMTPLHRCTRAFVDTAHSIIRRMDVVYFQNVPERVFQDPLLTRPVDFDSLLAEYSSTTGVLIVSDAGAARGYRRWARIRSTKAFLQRLRQRTNRIAWLNPMPRERWPDSSAERIAENVPMFHLDAAGLGGAVAVVRGHANPRNS